MEREELRTLPLAHPWTPRALQEAFAVVMGGVAYPGQRPGFAVVAGLCHPRAHDDCEIHVLDQAESVDLGDLLRACRGLSNQYRPLGTPPDAPFRWMGDNKHVGANHLRWRLSRESEDGYDHLSIEYAPMLDHPTPYLSMFALLGDLTAPDRKRLYLHGCRATDAMNEVPPDQVADAQLGDCPSIEALSFVVDGLRSWLDCQPRSPVDRNASPYRNWKRFNRGGRR